MNVSVERHIDKAMIQVKLLGVIASDTFCLHFSHLHERLSAHVPHACRRREFLRCPRLRQEVLFNELLNSTWKPFVFSDKPRDRRYFSAEIGDSSQDHTTFGDVPSFC